MRFNKLMETRFAGCPVIGNQDDPGRKRTISFFYLWSYPEHLGAFDGVDAWIISAASRPDLKRIADDIRDGKVKPEEFPNHPPARGRIRVATVPPASNETTKERRRVVIANQQQAQPPANQGRVRTRVQRAD